MHIPSFLHNLGYVTMNLFRQGLSIHIETGNQAGMAECLAGMAAALTAQGRAEDAARLFGTAEILREQSHAFLPKQLALLASRGQFALSLIGDKGITAV